MSKKYLVTSALPYANGPLHVGHLTGAYIPADIYVRYLRMLGEDVLFICGSDEHGAAITLRAKKEGITPRDIIDKYHPLNKDCFQKLGVSFDNYHRTSAELHYETASDFFLKLDKKDVFNVKKSEQYYDEEYNQFLADRYITGECPKCGHPAAYGDQCENCGSDLSPTDLINPKSTLSNKTPILKETKHWYLPMDKLQDWVAAWIEKQNQNESWKRHVYGQCQSWLKAGLQERAMTRDLDWGIPVPLENAEGKVFYVWLDAPIGYISATKDLTDDWESYWKNEDTKLVHFIGKDNIVFHCIIFPILLHLHGEGYILPTNIPANQFMNLEGDKMSTSRNYAVWLHEYLEDFPDKQDELRYYLTANMPENKDSDFSWQEFKDKNDKDLVGLLGGFVHRTLVLTQKNFEGQLPETVNETAPENIQKEIDAVHAVLKTFPSKINAQIHNYEFRNALNEVLNIAREGNRFLNETEPWKLAKTDLEATAKVLATCLEVVSVLSVFLEPFIPFSADKLKAFLNFEESDLALVLKGNTTHFRTRKVNQPEHLFKRFDLEAYKKEGKQVFKTLEAAMLAKENAAKADIVSEPKEIAPLKPTIQYDDFAKLDMRVGTILEAEKLKKSKKLLKLLVDIGVEKRQILSGIASVYSPEEIIGKKVIVLANLAPKKMAGAESQGMILMSDTAEAFTFINPEGEDSVDGASVS
ncbi:UNVERIFIED_CONTAM: hypothetical protein GTU68_032751 [Idotea baltica]|nr:hypothetical protein [Idotea baltica]